MQYLEFNINAGEGQQDIIMSFLLGMDFESFEEHSDTNFSGFIAENKFDESKARSLLELSRRLGFQYEKKIIEAQNWNAVWESNFSPIVINDFCCIRADFHQPNDKVMHEIIINPKMAFGTGHHETTHLMIQFMEQIYFDNTKVLDYGCGTGILSILASRMGAAHIDAVDIQKASYENTIQNCRLNGIRNVNPIHGTLSDISGEDYDVILANINRNVLLNSLVRLNMKLKKGGVLLLSGILKEDVNLMKKAVYDSGLLVKDTKVRNDWSILKCEK